MTAEFGAQNLTVAPRLTRCADSLLVTDDPGTAPPGKTIGPLIEASTA
jgi:hypothetical protein